jgi:hypothetical protein
MSDVIVNNSIVKRNNKYRGDNDYLIRPAIHDRFVISYYILYHIVL